MTISSIRVCLLAFLLFLPGPGAWAQAADAPPVPSEVTRIIDLYRAGDLAQAKLALEQYERTHFRSEHLPVIWLEAARAQGSHLDAVLLYRKLVETYPETNQAPLAQLELAQLFFVSANATAAAAEAMRFCEQYPDHAGVPEALILQATVEAQSGRIRSAANRYAEVAVRFPNTDAGAKAYVGLGDCKFRLDDLAGAQEAYFKALEKKSLVLDQGKIYYQLGLVAKKSNRPDQARRMFMLLVRNLPNSRYAPQAREALGVMGGAGKPGFSLIGRTLALPTDRSEVFAVRVADTDSRENAQQTAQRFTDARHKVAIRIKDERFEVLVGQFSEEMDAFFFAEQLEKKFNVTTTIVPLTP